MKNSIGLLFIVALLGLSSCLNSEPTPGPSFADQLKKDSVIISDYLSSKGLIALTDPDKYGVRYIVNVDGNGFKPTSFADSVTVNYTLKLLPSETQIEKSSAPTKFLLANLINGWKIGLPLIKEGSKATFYVPSGWGYGSAQSGAIPANSNLIFEIELISIVSQLKKDTTAINSYLNLKGISNAIKDQSGLMYTITSLGTGIKPTAESSITFNYTGKLMSTEFVFDKSTSPITSSLSDPNLIKGFRIAMPLLPVGTKATLYIPSTLAYGLQDRNQIPKNSNLIFDVELVSIK
jgi:FKBP-type peptidyl-prolyl cis-trans isomerase FkpA